MGTKNTKQAGRTKRRKLSKDEFRTFLPKKLNKYGEWLLANRDAWDYGNGKIVLK